MTPPNSPSSLAHFGIRDANREERILRLLVDLAVQFVGAQSGSLLIFDAAQNDLVFAMVGGDPDCASALIGHRLPLGTGLTGLAAVTHEPQIGEPTFYGIRQADKHGGEQTAPTHVLAVPVLSDDDLIGVLTAVTFDREKRFGPADAALYARVATVVALVMTQQRQIDSWRKGALDGSIDEGDRNAQQFLQAAIRIAGAHRHHLPALTRMLEALADCLGEKG